jgi:hypothetical protein
MVAAPILKSQVEIRPGRQKKGPFRVNFVKFDVEGDGELAPCGAASTLARPLALVIFEVNRDAPQRLAAPAGQAWKLFRDAGNCAWSLRESIDSSELKPRVPQTSENVTATYGVPG